MKTVVRRGLHTYGYLLIIATIITVFAALTTIGVSAEVTFDTNYYKYKGIEGVTITGFNNLSEGETVVIPAEIGGKPVLAIGLDGVVTTTSVPGAKKIGALDLTQAKNLKVILPHAFIYCTGFTSFIASNLTTVEEYAFANCKGLTSMDLPALKTIEEYAFYGCDGLKFMNCPNCNEVKTMAFAVCRKLTYVGLPQDCQIATGAFLWTPLE